jgi:hypothetical protein
MLTASGEFVDAADIGNSWTIENARQQPSQFAQLGLSISNNGSIKCKSGDRLNRPFTPQDIQMVTDGIPAANQRSTVAMNNYPPVAEPSLIRSTHPAPFFHYL